MLDDRYDATKWKVGDWVKQRLYTDSNALEIVARTERTITFRHGKQTGESERSGPDGGFGFHPRNHYVESSPDSKPFTKRISKTDNTVCFFNRPASLIEGRPYDYRDWRE